MPPRRHRWCRHHGSWLPSHHRRCRHRRCRNRISRLPSRTCSDTATGTRAAATGCHPGLRRKLCSCLRRRCSGLPRTAPPPRRLWLRLLLRMRPWRRRRGATSDQRGEVLEGIHEDLATGQRGTLRGHGWGWHHLQTRSGSAAPQHVPRIPCLRSGSGCSTSGGDAGTGRSAKSGALTRARGAVLLPAVVVCTDS